MNARKLPHFVVILVVVLMLGACATEAPESAQQFAEPVSGGVSVSQGSELEVTEEEIAEENVPPQVGDPTSFGTETDARDSKPEASIQAETESEQPESWVLFYNQQESAGSANVYWFDPNQGENLWSTLAPGEGYWQPSIVGLVWRVRNAANGDLLTEVVSQAGDQYAIVTVPGTSAGTAPEPTATQVPVVEPTATPEPQPEQSSSLAQQMLTVHNQERQNYHNVQLQWSPELAAVAQDWANHLASTGEWDHRSNDKEVNPIAPGQSLGENIWQGGAGGYTPAQGVQSWIDEKKWYDYNSDSCSATPPNSCGHFTQVVWKDTTLLGCGWATGSGSDYLVCNYYTPGNYAGQRPY